MGEGATPLTGGRAVSSGGETGSAHHLVVAGDLTAGAVVLLGLALVHLSFTSLARGFRIYCCGPILNLSAGGVNGQ